LVSPSVFQHRNQCVKDLLLENCGKHPAEAGTEDSDNLEKNPEAGSPKPRLTRALRAEKPPERHQFPS